MSTNPYSRFTYEELILRDHLAVDRTVVANERTVLSYVRTTLALGATGASLIHFLDSLAADIGGWVLIAVGVGLSVVGVARFLNEQRRLKILQSGAKTKGQ